MTGSMDRFGMEMQPFQGWGGFPVILPSVTRNALGCAMKSRWDWVLSSPQNVQIPGPVIPAWDFQTFGPENRRYGCHMFASRRKLSSSLPGLAQREGAKAWGVRRALCHFTCPSV